MALLGLCAGRLAYVHLHSVNSKDAILGEALDPLNLTAVLGLYGFGAVTGLLLLTCAVAGLVHLGSRLRRSRHDPRISTL